MNITPSCNTGGGSIIGRVVALDDDDPNMVEVELPTGKYIRVPTSSVMLLPRPNCCDERSDSRNVNNLARGSQVVVISRYAAALYDSPDNGNGRPYKSWSVSSMDMRVCNDVSSNTHDVLCAEVEGPGGDVEVIGWAIGRIALDVPACEFDTPLSEATIELTKEAFIRVWEMKCKMYTEFCTYHAAAARAQAIFEDYIVHSHAKGIRLSILDRKEEGSNQDNIFRETLIRKALKTILRLPLQRELAQRVPLSYASMALVEYVSKREEEDRSFSTLVSVIKQAARDKAFPCRQYFLKRFLHKIESLDDHHPDGSSNTSEPGNLMPASAASLSLPPTTQGGYCHMIYSALKSMTRRRHSMLHLDLEEAYTIFVRLGLISFTEGMDDFISDAQVREMMVMYHHHHSMETAAQNLENFTMLADSLNPRTRFKLAYNDHTCSTFVADVSKVNQCPIAYVILQKKVKHWYSVINILKSQIQNWNCIARNRAISLLTYNNRTCISSSSSAKRHSKGLGILSALSAEKTLQDAQTWMNVNQEKLGKGINVTFNDLSFQQDRRGSSDERGIIVFHYKLGSCSTSSNQFAGWIAPEG